MQAVAAHRTRFIHSHYRKWGALWIVGVPMLGAAGFTLWAALRGVHGPSLLIWGVQHAVGMLAMTVGAHRYFAHRSFRSGRWMTVLLGILSSATQGSILTWVAYHRVHHAHSDTAGDPHTPWRAGRDGPEFGWRSLLRGHLLWVFSGWRADRARYARDWLADPAVRWVDRLTPMWVAIPYGLPLVAGLLWLDGRVPLAELLLAGGTSVFTVQQSVFAVNSLGHSWGRRAFDTREQSRNSRLLALFTFGEGWHNNHHAHPHSARLGLEPGQWDLGYAVIALMGKARWAGRIRLASPAASRRTAPQSVGRGGGSVAG